MQKKILGFFYKTVSQFNGKPIVVIFTGISRKNKNSKIGGEFIQGWVLDEKLNPIAASHARKDQSVCGKCPQRHSLRAKDPLKRKENVGGCYVNLAHGPHSIWKAYKNGSYVELDLNNPLHIQAFKGRKLRLGAYGDFSMIDFAFTDKLMHTCAITEWTGYTHQYNSDFAQPYKKYLMASVENEEQAKQAQINGWRTFRVRGEGEAKAKNEFICPASAENDYKLTCADCMLCNGNGSKAKSVVIFKHGSYVKKIKNFSV